MKAVMLLALALSIAQAAEATWTLTLACEGTTTNTLGPDGKPEPISMSVVVNFTTRTVQGFGLLDNPVEITAQYEEIITFGGADKPNSVGQRSIISGAIELVTGELEATSSFWSATGSVSTSYSLKCKPTQRMF
jgi:hypothetical protein